MPRETSSTLRLCRLLVATAAAVVATLSLALHAQAASAGTLPSGFTDQVVLAGLANPTAIQFSPDGRIFVAEKSGVIKVFDNLDDPTPTAFADLSTNVYNYWDRGLLGLALDPNFPLSPYVYVMYTYDALPGGTAPQWGTPGVASDPCPTPPGPTADGCVVTGRISRLTASGDAMTGTERVLVQDWCQQYPSHSIGSLAFGADGALYASAGEGASWDYADYGQSGNPPNPCGDPPGTTGSTLAPPTAEGGALRSQDVLATSDPTGLDGTVIRIDPETGDAMPDNPLSLSPDANARRIIATGFRNPFRMTIRPGTNDVWLGDVGWNDWEEIDHLGSPTDSTVDNGGWPCYEGDGPQAAYEAANLDLCESLYDQGSSAVLLPVLAYNHNAKVVPGESCPSGGSSASALSFYTNGNYPSQYDDALFFGDYSRSCIWAILPGTDGEPDPARVETFDAGAAGPVNLTTGPGGDLFYVDLDGGTIHRISYLGANRAPTATVQTDKTAGPSPLTIHFDGTSSSDPEGQPLTYAWDLDGDGSYDDSTSATPQWTYDKAGSVAVKLKVTDVGGAWDTDLIVVSVGGDTPPVPTISLPASSTTWKVGDVIHFAGSAIDAQDGNLPASALSWSLIMRHCPSTCHTHFIQNYVGVSSGSFVAPDHDYPSHLELSLTATDSSGGTATTTLRLDPKTVDLTFTSDPSGLQLVVGSSSSTTPFTRRVIAGSNNAITATSPQSFAGYGYTFGSWSDGGAPTHNITAPVSAATYTASFTRGAPTPDAGLVAAYGFDEGRGASVADQSGNGNTGAIANATWATGKFGSALAFDGSDASVTVPDSPSLDLATGMTVEAWVKPSAVAGSWRTVVLKENKPDSLAYALYAGGNGPSPLGEITVGSNFDDASGSSSLPTDVWTHLAATYDGAALRLYVNGAMAASKAVVGALPSTADPLRIGGNGVWGEWFDGLIDEVRVYDRALTAAEIGTDMQRPVGGSSGGNVDTTPPTAPTGLSMTVTGSTVKLAWAAASDDVGVDHYNLYRSTSPGFTPAAANRIAEPTTTGYSDVGLAAGSYFYKLTAVDAAGNESTPSDQATATVDAQTTTGGLVAAYGMDAGSGTTLVDQSGNHNNGTLSNATWSASGKFGKALSFDGTNAFVSVPDSNSLDATSGLTVEGWAKPDGSTGFRALAVKETSGNIVYGLYANSDSNRPQSQVSTTNPLKLLDGTGTLPANTWSHVAFTYDGTTERLYVNGTQVESVAVSGAINTSTGALKIGGDAIWGEWFSGLIDEVRVYNRALSVAEIGQDMNTSISAPDSTPPSATGTLTATGGLGQVSLSWGAATDNTGVVKYDVYRSTTQGFTPSASNRIAQPTGLIYTDTGLTAGTTYYYRVTAEDAATNVGPATNEANATPTADTTPPTAPGSLTATGGAGKVTLSWNASTDAGGIARYNVHRGTTSGFTPTTANRIAQPTTTSYVDNGLSAGTYYYKVTADDNAGNTSAPSNEANATVGAAPPAGLVAAYGMDAGSGTTLVDQSGNGNNGTISNATWSASGKFGSALSFNGTNASVTIPDSNSLDATTGLTIEGWVKPTTSGGGAFRTMAVKETSGNLVYGLYVNSDSNRPQSQVTVGAPKLLDGTSAVPTGSWTHLAMTFDGTTERLFVNGTQVSSVAIAGSIATSTGALKIGGNSIWGEWYGGLIDELRVYNRALSASEITADMNTSISSPDSTPPSAPGTLTATGGLGQVSLSWGAATDNTGVVRYDVYRSTTQGFTPSASNRIAQPTTLTYTDNTGLTAGTTYYYRVTAEDAATNVGPASNEASATPTADTTPPTAPGSLTATGVPRKVTLGWNASTDAGGIARYNVYRSTTSGFTPSAGNRIAQPTTTSYVDNGLAAGTYYYKVTADDSAGNTSAASNEANATVPNGPPVGLVAAYGMDAGSGTTLVDQSGNGNNGTISNAAWSSSGKFGSALSFNGTNAVVSVPDSDSLDLTSGLTVEGWVKPDGSTGFRTLLVKETGGNIVYGLYANSDTNRPQSQVSTSNPLKLLDGTGTLPADTWSHLAFTYDGTTERLYVNGTQVASMAVSGAINTSTGALKIGGDAIWGEWFSGLIDEVRVYNRALSAAEIGSDMAKGVTGA